MPAAEARDTTAGDELDGRFTCVLMLQIAAALMLLASFTELDWFGIPQSEGGDVLVSFRALDLDVYQAASSGIVAAYYGWLAYACAGVAVAAGALLLSPRLPQVPLRVVSSGAAVAGVVVTLMAARVRDGTHTTGISTAEEGLWVALVAFVLIAAAAAIGPRPVFVRQPEGMSHPVVTGR